jgi:predicted RNase H-like HicB family nuclease
MKSYLFRVVVEPDEDRWHAYCPALDKYGAATWGYTKEEAEVFYAPFYQSLCAPG